MSKTAKKVIDQAKSWIGSKESDGSHKKIIDVYNSHKPLARGYKMKYTDSWCATFVSAVAIKLGYTDIIPTECGCQKMIDLFKKLGSWIENENRVPAPGEIIFYDWQDSGSGDNQGWSDHVGIVEAVNGNTITVIEGNYNNAVGRRQIAVNGKGIRGYGVPKYDAEPVEKPVEKPTKTIAIVMAELKKGSKGKQVEVLQRILSSYGCNLGSNNPFDGSFGPKTDTAVRAYQKAHGLTVDGIVGAKTWASLLGA
jgi:hypothetical protein